MTKEKLDEILARMERMQHATWGVDATGATLRALLDGEESSNTGWNPPPEVLNGIRSGLYSALQMLSAFLVAEQAALHTILTEEADADSDNNAANAA